MKLFREFCEMLVEAFLIVSVCASAAGLLTVCLWALVLESVVK